MKKFIMVLAAIAAVVMVGCSKDDDKGSIDLSGTTWEGADYYDAINYETLTLEFTSDTRVRAINIGHDQYDVYTDIMVGTYTLKGSTVVIKLDDYGDYWLLTGKIQGSIMDIYDDDGDYWMTLNKK